jgi:hypothetical protein
MRFPEYIKRHRAENNERQKGLEGQNPIRKIGRKKRRARRKRNPQNPSSASRNVRHVKQVCNIPMNKPNMSIVFVSAPERFLASWALERVRREVGRFNVSPEGGFHDESTSVNTPFPFAPKGT